MLRTINNDVLQELVLIPNILIINRSTQSGEHRVHITPLQNESCKRMAAGSYKKQWTIDREDLNQLGTLGVHWKYCPNCFPNQK